jgi:hypothetical protein
VVVINRKVILSRKGFDKNAGGKPSFIFEDRLITLPIPGDGSSGISHDHLRFDDRISLQQVMRDVGIQAYQDCHLDPDLYHFVYPNRHAQWRPAFGQTGGQETRLQNNSVKEGDLFLFYGWFKQIRLGRSGRFEYIQNARNLHVIYGYLEVDEVFNLEDPKVQVPDYLHYHPHVVNRANYGRRNRIYTGIKAGLFKFHNDLILTRSGQTRSRWELPVFFENEQFAGGRTIQPLENGKIAVDFVGINNQELLITSSRSVVSWAEDIISRLPLQ